MKPAARDRGFTLLEVLITIVVLAVGMLGLANLQSKIHITEIESYQRAHAVLLLQDMVDRINSNRARLAIYAAAPKLGTLTTKNCDAATLAGFSDVDDRRAHTDLCEWSSALLGASEQSTSGNAGGMIGARGCVQQLLAPDPTAGICTAGIYRVTVAWQGLHKTAEPPAALSCAEGDYTDDTMRRVISAEFSIGLPTCNTPL
jgi:type IV pilus assembly protein PilV